jgi:hypothetical protein
MLNPFFLQGSSGEQNLIQDLINEQLRMYGIEVYYIPRIYLTEKTIIKEVIESSFDSAYPIEAYIENFDGYGDNTTILSKFGIQALNEITLTISKERFETYITPLTKKKSGIKLATRPKEGDLVYFPLGDRLFEIKFVEHEKPFYQLQKNYVYQLKCELFRYEDEIIDTGVGEIDDTLSPEEYLDNEEDVSTIVGNVRLLTLVGSSSTAYAEIGITSGSIQFINVTNRGGGYITTPTVAISSAPSGGKTGIATASMIEGIVVCNSNVNPLSKSVQSVSIINPGYGYTVAPKIKFIGGGGSGAAATSVISNNSIGIVTITNGGNGYTSPPQITFINQVFLSGVATASAAAVAVVSAAGTIGSILITNSGAGYSTAPTIRISGSGSTSFGTFEFNEIVTGSLSGTTARVRDWNSVSNILQVYKVNGDFSIGERIVGTSSSASYTLRSTDEFYVASGYGSNKEIELESDQIIDFTEKNPFGMP